MFGEWTETDRQTDRQTDRLPHFIMKYQRWGIRNQRRPLKGLLGC